MAKYFGKIGYIYTVETSPGIWESVTVEKEYYGDLIRNTRRIQSSADKLNSDIDISNQLSIVSDAYANDNYFAIKYAVLMNQKWSVTTVDVNLPRLTLTLGGLYNG